MSFSRKIFVAVTSSCVCVCACVCVCVRGGEMKQKVNFCNSAECELNNYDRLIVTNVTD